MKRVATALLLIPVVLALVRWAPLWLLALGLLPVALLALWEFLELADRLGQGPTRLPVFLGSAVLLGLAAARPDQSQWLLAGLSAVGLGLLVVEGLRRKNLAEVLPATAAGVLGMAYVGLPMALFLILGAQPQGREWLLYGLLLTWVGDTAAYTTGRSLGRHALAPRLSPKKTWEGTAAGFAATLAVGLWLGPRLLDPHLSLFHVLLLSALLNGVSQIGDLAESALKRGAGVKDSSRLLPGHGGVLDRIDGLLFVSPVLCYYFFAVQ